jgi:hypothetical protein
VRAGERGADRWGPSVSGRARVGRLVGLSGPKGQEGRGFRLLSFFSFITEFLILFPFVFFF